MSIPDQLGMMPLLINSLRINIVTSFMISIVATTIASLLYLSPVRARVHTDHMLSTLESVAHVFKTSYAPLSWKKEFSNWDVDQKMSLAKESVRQKPNMSIKEFHNVLKDFFNSTNDYHVSAHFVSTEKAKLHFSLKHSEGRFFISYINKNLLSHHSFPFSIGDELTLWNGKPVSVILAALLPKEELNSKLTDHALATIELTSRLGSKGQKIPRGSVLLNIRKKGSSKSTLTQVPWDYFPEKINIKSKFFPAFADKSLRSLNKSLSFHSTFAMDLAEEAKIEDTANRFSMGARISHVPQLGKALWKSKPTNPFYSYTFQTADEKKIGFLRIPSYSADAKESTLFQEIIKRMQDETDALVIDQVNNPGGSVFYLYSLVSMLTDTAMSTPRHQISINAIDAMDAISTLEVLNQVKNDTHAKKIFGETIGGYPVSAHFSNTAKNYYQFILSEFNRGAILTEPHHLYGVDYILPHPDEKARYTKPIIILINELDFSGGDFFPAIMQDNKRATIFGTRTSGAGGYVKELSIPNHLGLKNFSITGSIAMRLDGRPIENMGVTPDIHYSLQPEDYQNNMLGYKEKILSSLKVILEK